MQINIMHMNNSEIDGRADAEVVIAGVDVEEEYEDVEMEDDTGDCDETVGDAELCPRESSKAM